MKRKQFDIPAVLRILQSICDRYPDDVESCQIAAKKQLRSMGIVVDLEETQRRHEEQAFAPEADIILIADDGMMFIHYKGRWIVGRDADTGYLCFYVTPDHIENIGPNQQITIINA